MITTHLWARLTNEEGYLDVSRMEENEFARFVFDAAFRNSLLGKRGEMLLSDFLDDPVRYVLLLTWVFRNFGERGRAASAEDVGSAILIVPRPCGLSTTGLGNVIYDLRVPLLLKQNLIRAMYHPFADW